MRVSLEWASVGNLMLLLDKHAYPPMHVFF